MSSDTTRHIIILHQLCRRMSGTGLTHRESKRRKVNCPLWDEEVQESSLGRNLAQHLTTPALFCLLTRVQ